MLRQFLYRDDILIREFLAQAEGGIVDQDEVRERADKGHSVGGQAGASMAKVSAQRSKGRSEESARVVKQTGASEFDRLYRTLESSGDVQYLDAIDDGIWEQLSRGEIIEAEVVVRQTGLAKITDLFSQLTEILPAVNAASDDVQEFDDSTRAIVGVLQALNSMSARSEMAPVVASLASVPEYKFASDLRLGSVTGSLDTLEGEVTLCAKLQRKLKKDEKYMMPAVFGGLEQLMDEDARDQLATMFADPAVINVGIASPRLSYPAAIVTPIAIYR
jgi:hypothetical protein